MWDEMMATMTLEPSRERDRHGSTPNRPQIEEIRSPPNHDLRTLRRISIEADFQLRVPGSLTGKPRLVARS